MARNTIYNRYTDHFKATAVRLSELQGVQIQHVAEALDTNKHQFESIQCLKNIREFFVTNPVIQSNGVKAAFVQSYEYMRSHVKSENEPPFLLAVWRQLRQDA